MLYRKIWSQDALHTTGQKMPTSRSLQLLPIQAENPLRPPLLMLGPLPSNACAVLATPGAVPFFQSSRSTRQSLSFLNRVKAKMYKPPQFPRDTPSGRSRGNNCLPPLLSPLPGRNHTGLKHSRKPSRAFAGPGDALLPLAERSQAEMAHLTTQVLEERWQLRVSYGGAVTRFLRGERRDCSLKLILKKRLVLWPHGTLLEVGNRAPGRWLRPLGRVSLHVFGPVSRRQAGSEGKRCGGRLGRGSRTGGCSCSHPGRGASASPRRLGRLADGNAHLSKARGQGGSHG